MYKFRDLTIEELKNVNKIYPNFLFSMDTYTFKDGSQKDLLNFSGTVPITYHGHSYNIPVRLWILDSHPFAPPICFLKPTVNMGISVGKHVDAHGRIYLPYLQNWSHPKSTVIGLIKEMTAKFDEELPLYSLSSSDAARQLELLSFIAKFSEGETDMKSKSQVEKEKKNETCNKVTVIGAGDLGIACVLAITAKGAADQVVLLDPSEGAAKGGIMDLDIFDLPNVEISKDFSASADSKVVVFTVNYLGNAQSYLDVIQSNVDLFRGIVPAIAHHSQNSVLLVASHPVEIMTYVSWKLSAFPKSRVIGIGCNLDTERFQYVIANLLKAQTVGKEAWIIGEQGEGKVPAWTGSNSATCQTAAKSHHNSREQLANRAMEVLKGKGQRSWSVALSIADLIESILKDKRKVHSVSTLAKYKYRDLTVQETISVITQYKDLKPVMDAYVFNDGSSRELMSLSGTIPVPYRGNTYNIPICLWLLDTYPFNPPICFVKPTSSMTIKTGKHVDANGKIYLPYLHEWKHPQSDLLELIQVMIVVFGEEPPVFSRPTISASYPPYQPTGPPNASYMPGMPSGISPYPPGHPPNPSGYPSYPYPSGVPFPATTSAQHYPSQPPVTAVADTRRKQKQVWICGHSYVLWAEKRALSRSFGPQLGIRVEDAKLHWIGKRGMMWDQLIPMLLHARRHLPDPEILVIHLGGNDLGTTKLMNLIIRIKKDLGFIRHVFKNVILVWSTIVPRKAWWNQDEACKLVDENRKKVNSQISNFMKSIGGFVIRHDSLVPESPGLFHLNGVLLSESGTDVFNLDLLSVLENLI
ncbi:ubiquitin-conjugating enzyme E2 variant 3 isoform X2 [Alligator sinensis]|uniref:Ubiquitin-conjugating enzyme E2 variant 3 isoform X2 n=1 Tax=Alligator sinensis TaxID=38654 RepID=A0A3Q0GE12_ALLSI|nr:ubiquitin-conjugating enzyme E2 variant 3 isoform X2 [Alligator sinensis]